MFEEHIAWFELFLPEALRIGPGASGATLATIELMRAAKPKDDAAEQRHCLQVANDSPALPRAGELCGILMCERAAARAEGYAACKATLGASAMRAAAQSRIDYLESELQTARAELKAVEAERAHNERACNLNLTKLANLQTAAERFMRSQHWRGNYENAKAFFAAIEASRLLK